MSGGVFIEAAAGESGRWLIRVIRAGLSANGVFYPDAVLREAAVRFDGVRVFQKPDAEHIKGGGKDVRNLIGGLTNVRFVEGAAPDAGELQAELVLIEPEGDVSAKLRGAFERSLTHLFGFSIDAGGTAKTMLREGRKVRVATSLSTINSVDLIVEPGAGGELIRLVEARQSTEEDAMRETLLKFLEAKHPKHFARLSAEATDDEVLAVYHEAVEPKEPPRDTRQDDAMLAEVRLVEARITARELITACTLPDAAKAKLTARFVEAKTPFTADEVKSAIDDERAYLAKFVESGRVQLPGLDIQVEDRSKKIGEMLDDFFAGKNGAHSFRECYIEITGDRRVTGRVEHCDRVRLREALGADFREAVDTAGFSLLLGNAMHRQMLADYRTASEYDGWRQISGTPVPLSDFRENQRVTFGGYGDLPKVAEKGNYEPLASPTDEKAVYAPEKRGGTESVTLETIRNDDVGAIRRIPQKMARAARRTLSKFVFDFIRTNPVIYDTKALFHVDHANLFDGALTAEEFAKHRLAMMKQVEAGSNDPIGVGPSFLLVPVELQETAWNLFQRATNLDKTFIQSLTPQIIPVWYWTDANDWATVANPADIPTIEIGFLDGQEEPELFVQDLPTVGSFFTNDTITYKIRHIYGGAVMRYQGMTKAVVA